MANISINNIQEKNYALSAMPQIKVIHKNKNICFAFTMERTDSEIRDKSTTLEIVSMS